MGQRLLGLQDRMVLRELASLFASILAGATLLYVLIDFADRSTMIGKHALTAAAAEFYANKAAVIVYQVAPGALVIAAAMIVARLGQRGELTAIFALGSRPARLLVPVGLLAAAVGAALFAFGELAVVGADARMDEIVLRKFGDWGDYQKYHPEVTWIRSATGFRFYKLGRRAQGGFEPVTILELAAPFRLERRLDARRLEPAGERRYRLLDVLDTRSAPAAAGGPPGGKLEQRVLPELLLELPETAGELNLRAGRPRQIPFARLLAETNARERAGQPVLEWKLAFSERLSQAAVSLLGALAGFLFALATLVTRRSRSLAASIALGLLVTSGLWVLATIAHAAAITGRLPPFLGGAVAPGSALLASAALSLRVRV